MAVTIKHTMFTALFFTGAVFYLSFHILHGEQGLYALLVQSHNQEKLEAELREVRARRLVLEHKVTLMSDDAVDPDLLDEEVRRYLGLVGKDEIIIITTQR